MTTRILNWRKDPAHEHLPDHVPHLLARAAPLPTQTDLGPGSPPVYDQGNLGSCTAHAIAGVFHVKEWIKGTKAGNPARLFIYQMELLIQGTWGKDEGSTIPTGMRAALLYGLPPESVYPYIVSHLAMKPSQAVMTAGRARRATQAMEAKVTLDHDHIVATLAALEAIACGFSVPTSFMNVGSDGVWKGPEAGDKIEGGHAVAIVGHDDVQKTYKIRNSWGTGWGRNGYVFVPQDFVHSQFSDLMAAIDAPAA